MYAMSIFVAISCLAENSVALYISPKVTQMTLTLSTALTYAPAAINLVTTSVDPNSAAAMRAVLLYDGISDETVS